MQESLDLPPSEQRQTLHHQSPQTNIVKLNKYSNNESQQSLLYSNSTYKQDTHRSPKFINLPLLQVQKSKIRVQDEKSSKRVEDQTNKSRRMSVNLEKKDFQNFINAVPPGSLPLHKLKAKNEAYQKYNPVYISSGVNDQRNQRKTMQNGKAQLNRLIKKNKQLEYALQLEIMSSQELRTRLKIMSQMLQKNIKQSNLTDFLKLKNTSNMSSVDLFVQFQKYRSIFDQNQKQIKRLCLQNQNFTKHFSLLNNENSKLNKKLKNQQNDVIQLKKQIQKLKKQNSNQQDHQSLYVYIQELKKEHEILKMTKNTLQKKHNNLQQEIKNILKQNKSITQSHNSIVQKFKQQINILQSQKKQFIILQNQNLQIRKQNQNLIAKIQNMTTQYQHQINNRNQIINAMEQRILTYQNKQNIINAANITSSRHNKSDKQGFSSPNQTVSFNKNQQQVQQVNKQALIEELKWQLQTNKQTLEYYQNQYRKKMKQSAQLHALKLRYKTQINTLRKSIKQYALKYNQPQFQKILEDIEFFNLLKISNHSQLH